MAISKDEVEHVARLARLDLTQDEVTLFAGQLDAVLDRAQRLQALDVGDLPATAHPVPDLRNVLRPDEVLPPTVADRIVDNAPEREDQFFKVPRILEDEG